MFDQTPVLKGGGTLFLYQTPVLKGGDTILLYQTPVLNGGGTLFCYQTPVLKVEIDFIILSCHFWSINY